MMLSFSSSCLKQSECVDNRTEINMRKKRNKENARRARGHEQPSDKVELYRKTEFRIKEVYLVQHSHVYLIMLIIYLATFEWFNMSQHILLTLSK